MRSNFQMWATAIILLLPARPLLAQTATGNGVSDPHADQISRILGFDQRVQQLRELQEQHCGTPPSLAEISLKQELSQAEGAKQIEGLKIFADVAALDGTLDQGVDGSLDLRARPLVELRSSSHEGVQGWRDDLLLRNVIDEQQHPGS